jgi:hypothetical protein
MDYIPVADTVQVDLFMIWDGQSIENVFHFKPDVAVDPFIMFDLGAHLVTWWNANRKTDMPTNLQLSAIKLTDLSTQTGTVVNYGTGLPLVGTNVSPSLPNNCALVVTKRTAKRGRSFRGRIYAPGLVEAGVTGNTVSAGFVTAALNAYGLIRNFAVGATNWDMVVVSRKQGGQWLVNGETNEVTTFTSDGVVDSQRRRLPGRGA